MAGVAARLLLEKGSELVTRLPARAVPRTAKPLPRQNGAANAEPSREAISGLMFLAGYTAFMCGEIDLLTDECIALAVEVGPDTYEPDSHDTTIPGHAIIGQSKPLEGKRVEDATFYVSSFRVDVPEGRLLNGLVLVVNATLIYFQPLPHPILSDGGSYPVSFGPNDYFFQIVS